MTQREVVKLAKKYISAANELDKAGLTQEAAQIDKEIFMAIEKGYLPIKLKVVKIASNKSNTRLAIIGQSDWNDYAENMAQGAGAIAGGALGSVALAPSAPVGALLGAAGGAISTLAGDALFNHLQGQTSQLESLNNGLTQTVQGLVQTVSGFDPASAQMIQQLADGLQQNIAAAREKKRVEISQSVGLDPDQGLMQSLNPLNWNKVLKRKWQMTTSNSDNYMKKTAAQSDILNSTPIDPVSTLGGYAKQLTPSLSKIPKLTGWQGAGAIAGGIAGGMAGQAGYNWLANKMRGQAGVLQKQISDIQKYGASIAKLSQDQSVLQITQQIASLAQGALQSIQSGQQPMYAQQGMNAQQVLMGGQQSAPAQYSSANQTFR